MMQKGEKLTKEIILKVLMKTYCVKQAAATIDLFFNQCFCAESVKHTCFEVSFIKEPS